VNRKHDQSQTGGWRTLSHTTSTHTVEFPGACLPQAGPILRAFVSGEGSEFRRRAATTAPLNSCLATSSHAAEALRPRYQNREILDPSVCT
jgi:hypothetical protein